MYGTKLSQGYGCNAIANLAYNVTDNVKRIGDSGGIGVILSALRENPDATGLHTVAWVRSTFLTTLTE